MYTSDFTSLDPLSGGDFWSMLGFHLGGITAAEVVIACEVLFCGLFPAMPQLSSIWYNLHYSTLGYSLHLFLIETMFKTCSGGQDECS